MLGERLSFGCTQESHVAGTNACTARLSPGLLPMLLTTVSWSRNCANGSRIGLTSKSAPVLVGGPFPMRAPGEKKKKPRRGLGAAAVLARAVAAGTIASRKGSEMAAPKP